MRQRLLEALKLKDLPRSGWVRAGVENPESVAAHSWGVAWLVLVLCPGRLDRGRALALAVVHDLAEVVVGDLTPHDDVSAEEKQLREGEALVRLAPNPEISVLFGEYQADETPEARFVKACDKLDMALQATFYGREQGLDLREFVESALGRLTDPDMRALAGESDG